jgi:hypothetical protein
MSVPYLLIFPTVVIPTPRLPADAESWKTQCRDNVAILLLLVYFQGVMTSAAATFSVAALRHFVSQQFPVTTLSTENNGCCRLGRYRFPKSVLFQAMTLNPAAMSGD